MGLFRSAGLLITNAIFVGVFGWTISGWCRTKLTPNVIVQDEIGSSMGLALTATDPSTAT